MAPSLRETIIELEDQTWKALSEDGAALIPYLSHDCIMLFPMGMKVTASSEPNLKQVMTSEAFVPWETYKMSDVEVTPIGTDAAIISYRVKAFRQPLDSDEEDDREAPPPFVAFIASTWRRNPHNEKWLMCFQQQTPYQDSELFS